MDPSQNAGMRGRSRSSNRRGNEGARPVVEGAGDIGHVVDRSGCVVEKGATESNMLDENKSRVTMVAADKALGVDRSIGDRDLDPSQYAGRGECARRSSTSVEKGFTGRGHVLNIDKGACAIKKGTTEIESAPVSSTMNDENKLTFTMDVAVKGFGLDKGIANTSFNSKGRYIYNGELDHYELEPVGSEEKRSYILLGTIYRELLQHQTEGIEWLWGVHCQHKGCIVADDMGLGKTFQATAFLAGLLHSNLVRRVLIIVPLSVLLQWPLELKKAGIDHLVQVFHDSDDTGLKKVMKTEGILLTTYETYASNHKKLMGSSRACWDYVILDEAHRIKNIESQITGFVNKVHSKKKVLLTGTPIQKDLMDLYSLMHFINPGVLGDLSAFRKNYLHPINLGKYANVSENEKAEYRKALKDVRVLTTPYVLRRDKEVLIQSGHLRCQKHDMVIWLKLTKLQKRLYKKCEEIHLNRTGQGRESAIVKSMVWQTICNSPSALLSIQDEDNEEEIILKSLKHELLNSFDVQELRDNINSCKTTFVLELVKEIFKEEEEEKEEAKKRQNQKDEKKKERKLLIFSRSLNMLNIIEKCLSQIVEDDKITRIDGSVKKEKRLELIKSFNFDNGPKILLLSAKVGGEGLNLTAATRVIIVDPSWNSSDDSQISDRVYRMGQEEDVYIYRLITCRTVEEHTYRTQLLKGALGRGITDGMVCASSVRKKDGKILCLPDKKVGFNSSETFQLLESTKANELDFDGRHLRFLMTHPLVYGITNQKFVLSKDECSLSDVPHESCSRWNDFEVERKLPELFQASTTKANFQQTLNTKKMSHMMDIPESKVGILMGRDRQAIRNIRLASATNISVEITRVDSSSHQRSLNITGSKEGVEKAKQMIVELIYEANKEEYFPFPSGMVGKVIGYQGRTVKAIKEQSGAFVKFDKDKQSFQIVGSKNQIGLAKELICKTVDKTEDEIREFQEKYLSVPATKIGLVIGKQGSMLKELKQKTGASVKFIDDREEFLLTGSQQAIDSAEALILQTIDKSCSGRSGHLRHAGHDPTSACGAIGESSGSQRHMPPNREYYGERGPPNEKKKAPQP